MLYDIDSSHYAITLNCLTDNYFKNYVFAYKLNVIFNEKKTISFSNKHACIYSFNDKKYDPTVIRNTNILI